jgi:hypothetical protein
MRKSDALMADIKDANRQLPAGQPNVLVLVPDFEPLVYSERDPIIEAMLGEHSWLIVVPPDGKERRFPVRAYFKFSGMMTRPGAGGRADDGTPRRGFTRISAVVVLEEVIRQSSERRVHPDASVEDSLKALRDELAARAAPDHRIWAEPRVLVVHGPAAAVPMGGELFGDVPQLIHVGDEMTWTDYVPPEPEAWMAEFERALESRRRQHCDHCDLSYIGPCPTHGSAED